MDSLSRSSSILSASASASASASSILSASASSILSASASSILSASSNAKDPSPRVGFIDSPSDSNGINLNNANGRRSMAVDRVDHNVESLNSENRSSNVFDRLVARFNDFKSRRNSQAPRVSMRDQQPIKQRLKDISNGIKAKKVDLEKQLNEIDAIKPALTKFKSMNQKINTVGDFTIGRVVTTLAIKAPLYTAAALVLGTAGLIVGGSYKLYQVSKDPINNGFKKAGEGVIHAYDKTREGFKFTGQKISDGAHYVSDGFKVGARTIKNPTPNIAVERDVNSGKVNVSFSSGASRFTPEILADLTSKVQSDLNDAQPSGKVLQPKRALNVISESLKKHLKQHESQQADKNVFSKFLIKSAQYPKAKLRSHILKKTIKETASELLDQDYQQRYSKENDFATSLSKIQNARPELRESRYSFDTRPGRTSSDNFHVVHPPVVHPPVVRSAPAQDLEVNILRHNSFKFTPDELNIILPFLKGDEFDVAQY